MSRRLILVLTFAFVVGIAFAAYAEVQNVKVSGDIAASALGRWDFGLSKGAKPGKNFDHENLFLTQTRVKVDADLTDNVAATVRLINERVWDNNEDGVTTYDQGDTSILLDLAYVTLKEFLYSPLSVTVGRQEIRWGNALIIGNANATADISDLTGGVPTDLSLQKSFDAVKAVLNYDPLVIESFYAQIDAGTTRSSTSGAGQGIAVYGANLSYDLGKKNTKANLYYVGNNNHVGSGTTGAKTQQINTIGTLVSSTPIENLSTSLEYAYQFGANGWGTTESDSKRIKAWALEFIGNYGFPKVKYTPTLGLTYVYLSGDKNSTDSNVMGWNSLYYDQAVTNIAYAILPFSNVQVFSVNGSIKPMEDLRISAVWAHYLLNQRMGGTLASNKYDSAGNRYLTTTMNHESKNLGYEVDATATYDYTEDVQLGLTYGFYKPGKAFPDNDRTTAQQLIGSMKVSF